MKNRNLFIASLLVILALAGCAGHEAVKPQPSAAAEEKSTTAASAPAGVTGTALSEQEKQRAALLAQHRVHFAFDSSAIDNEARAIIEAHAANLVAKRQIKVTLEGHCDERGTREYNLALGERRAKSVERMMKVLGVAANRIKTVSYGKEKPLCSEHEESCWHQNRRVEIIYR